MEPKSYREIRQAEGAEHRSKLTVVSPAVWTVHWLSPVCREGVKQVVSFIISRAHIPCTITLVFSPHPVIGMVAGGSDVV